METLITSGVEISVETFFQDGASNPVQYQFLFAYRITISNHNRFPIQLLRRKWVITDMNGDVELVEGEGVVGRQPVLYAGESFEYTSGCNLSTPFGKMEGEYIFENKLSSKEFEAKIPLFKLEAPQLLN